MSALRAMRIALIVATLISAGNGVRAQTSAGTPAETPDPPPVIVGYVRDTEPAAYASSGAAILRYRDRRKRVISVSIRPMTASGTRWSQTEEADSITRVQDEILRGASAEEIGGSCRIAYADNDSIQVVGGMVRGRALANVCLIGDSTVDRLLYTYLVRDNVMVFQSTMTQAQWKTSNFERFIHELVQAVYASTTDRISPPSKER